MFIADSQRLHPAFRLLQVYRHLSLCISHFLHLSLVSLLFASVISTSPLSSSISLLPFATRSVVYSRLSTSPLNPLEGSSLLPPPPSLFSHRIRGGHGGFLLYDNGLASGLLFPFLRELRVDTRRKQQRCKRREREKQHPAFILMEVRAKKEYSCCLD